MHLQNINYPSTNTINSTIWSVIASTCITKCLLQTLSARGGHLCIWGIRVCAALTTPLFQSFLQLLIPRFYTFFQLSRSFFQFRIFGWLKFCSSIKHFSIFTLNQRDCLLKAHTHTYKKEKNKMSAPPQDRAHLPPLQININQHIDTSSYTQSIFKHSRNKIRKNCPSV